MHILARELRLLRLPRVPPKSLTAKVLVDSGSESLHVLDYRPVYWLVSDVVWSMWGLVEHGVGGPFYLTPSKSWIG